MENPGVEGCGSDFQGLIGCTVLEYIPSDIIVKHRQGWSSVRLHGKLTREKTVFTFLVFRRRALPKCDAVY